MRTARRVRRDVTGAGLLLLALALGCGEGGLFGSAFIRVASPNGGETWEIGAECDITWASSSVAKVKIELSRDGGNSWEELAASRGAGRRLSPGP